MRKTVAWLLIFAMTASLAGCEKKPETTTEEVVTTEEVTTEKATEEETEEATEEALDPYVNMISNGDFSDGASEWTVYTNMGQGSIAVEDEEMIVNVDKVGDLDYCVQVNRGGFGLEQGVKYQLSFDVKCDIEREFEWRIQINGGDYHPYISDKEAKATTEYTTIEVEFEMTDDSDPAPSMCFNLGNHVGAEKGVDPHKMYFDNVCLKIIDDSGRVVNEAVEIEEKNININQVGYKTTDDKIAVFRGDKADKEFNVVDAESEKVIYTGTIDDKFVNKTADETNYYGDFSSLTEAGTYKIVTETMGESYSFTISDDVYDDVYSDVINMLYLQRCGVALSEKDAGAFAHKACHTSKATIYGTNKTIDVSGGWHDAGDYGRYVVPGAKTVADLLLTVADNDSENSKAILAEAKYELDWMLKMQDSATGGVYHKVTCAVFPGEVMPEEETDELIVSPISTTATGDFAAVMAMASEAYRSSNKSYADKCLKASKAAYEYLAENLAEPEFKNPSDIATGEYGDNSSRDEYFWAAAELYKVTGEDKYLEVIKNIIKNKNYSGLGWQEVGAYGLYAYLTTEEAALDSSTTYKDAKDKFLAIADKFVETAKSDGYRVSVGESYPWGSNMTVANNGMLLLMANKIEPKKEYTEAAKAHLDYILGTNATTYCFVTGYGTLSPSNPHHRPSQVAGECMVGMLIGGPDSDLEDPYAKQVLKDLPAAKCYADSAQSYSCNEVTIYWNSPLIYLISGVE